LDTGDMKRKAEDQGHKKGSSSPLYLHPRFSHIRLGKNMRH
jgi:hypothetical protein